MKVEKRSEDLRKAEEVAMTALNEINDFVLKECLKGNIISMDLVALILVGMVVAGLERSQGTDVAIEALEALLSDLRSRKEGKEDSGNIVPGSETVN